MWLAIGCTTIPADRQRPVGIVMILAGIAAMVFSRKFGLFGRSSTANLLVGAIVIVLGLLVVLGDIHFPTHCPEHY